MYAEKSLEAISEKNGKDFAKVLTGRLKSLEKETQKKRVERVLKKIGESSR